jgi:molybdate transport system substrate-binding protein
VRRLLIGPLALVLVLGACSSDDDGGSGSTDATEAVEPAELTVFAASSLTNAFTDEIGPAFEAAHEGTTVVFNFAASDALAGQIQSEGTADVFASASGTWMDATQDDPGVSDRTDFVRNRLVIITPPDNPAGIASIDDLANDGVQLVLAAEGVPVGDYAREALANAGIADEAEANVVSNEEDNASVISKIASGEGDVGIVYESDISVAAGNDVASVAIPDDLNVIATYPIAVVNGGPNAELAAEFIEYVTGPDGQATLEEYGFTPVT